LIERLEIHDAILWRVAFEWRARTVDLTIQLVGHKERSSLQFFEVSALALGAEWPWGESVSIDRLSIERHDSKQKYIISIQSGDVVEVVADGYSFMEGEN